MGTVYLVVVFLVTSLLIALALLPFCKVWSRIRSHHPAIWARGPFDVRSLLSHGSLLTDFITIANMLYTDKDLRAQDKTLARWSLRCSQIYAMKPKGFLSQIGYALVFIYFVHLFTTLIIKSLGLGG